MVNYRKWNAPVQPATPAQLQALRTQPAKPHRGFRNQKPLQYKRKNARYSDGWLVSLVALRYGSLVSFS